MTGLPPFLLEKNDTFQTSFKKLIKSYKSKSQQQDFIRFISNQIESLIINPYPAQSRTDRYLVASDYPIIYNFIN